MKEMVESFEFREDATLEDLSDQERQVLEKVARRVVEEDASLQEALGVGEAFVETMEFYAHQLYEYGKLDRAGVLVEGILALDETRYYPYLLIGDIAMQRERWEDAVVCLGAAVSFGPESSMLEGKLGEALVRAGRPDDAVVHLQRAVALSEQDGEMKYGRRSASLLELIGREVERVAGE